MNTIVDMRASVFFEGESANRKVSRFWILLTLASIIASAGVVGDSTATVIGAMIVAPLMTPILGVVLATVLGDRRNLLRSWTFVIAGAGLAILTGFLVGLTVATPVVAATNGQVAGRVSPHLIDLLAALATGVVGAIALVRKDISDTLPGVAIAISLVPPLTVVGLTAEAGEWDQAMGALLLFVTNVAAILATGVAVLAIYRVSPDEEMQARRAAANKLRLRPLITLLAAVLVIGVPLTATSVRIGLQSWEERSVTHALEPWVAEHDWRIADLTQAPDGLHVTLTGEPPLPDTSELESALRDAGVDPAGVVLQFVPAYEIRLGDGD